MSEARELLRHGREQAARGDRDAAIDAYRRAILADPRDSATYAHLTSALFVGGFLPEARKILRIGLQQIPGSPVLHWAACMVALPIVPASVQEREEGIAAFAQALHALRAVCFASQASVAESLQAVGFLSPFLLPYLGHCDPALMALHGGLAADILAAAFPFNTSVSRAPRGLGDPIRVGIVSGFFLRHSVWRLPTRGWVDHIDRSRFRLFGYHTRPETDTQTEYAAETFDKFEAGVRPLFEWVRMIEEDAPHVLIYPEIGADQISLQLAALRLAPVQCTTWGQPVTTGLPTIDHYISSALMEPPDADMHYTENLVRLPGLGTVFKPEYMVWEDPLPESDLWAATDFPDDAVRLLCCQGTPKYRPEYDDLYPRIALEMPNARFLFIDMGQRGKDIFWGRLYAAFARHGLDATIYCRFMPVLPQAGFSALIRGSHVYLDTIDWSGCNTTLDAIGHHIPVVTLPGSTMRARHGLAILSITDVKDTIVHTVDDYIAMVVRLGRDAAFRESISQRLATGKSRLYGDITPVQALEAFLEDAVDRALGQ